MKAAAAIALLLASLGGPASAALPQATPEPADEHAGLWRIPQSQIDEVNARAKAQGLSYLIGEPDPFYFDGTTITLVLRPFFSVDSMDPLLPADGIYRLRTRWEGDDLSMLPPKGDWVRQVRWRDGAFEVERESGIGPLVWRYERVAVEDASPYLRRLAAPREPWTYPHHAAAKAKTARPR